jgi:hypothetical protein
MVLGPGEMGKVEIVFDTLRFRGPRTQFFYLEMDTGKPIVAVFKVRADSTDETLP